jgi:hypothetical protein
MRIPCIAIPFSIAAMSWIALIVMIVNYVMNVPAAIIVLTVRT